MFRFVLWTDFRRNKRDSMGQKAKDRRRKREIMREEGQGDRG